MLEFINNNIILTWFFLGFVLLLFETLIPGLVLVFFGIASWIVSFLLLLFPISIPIQIGIFIFFSCFLTFIFHKFFKKITKNEDELSQEFKGEKAVVSQKITPQKDGKIIFQGTEWVAESNEVLEKDVTVIIIDNQSIRFLVKGI